MDLKISLFYSFNNSKINFVISSINSPFKFEQNLSTKSEIVAIASAFMTFDYAANPANTIEIN